jgi:gliding motility-associated-like protein
MASAVLVNVPEFARYFGSLQLGPDGKIYVVRLSQPYLGVIQNPNAVGAACQYKEEGVDLNELYYWYGLPNFISNYLVPAIPDIAGPGQVCANTGSVRYSVKRTACDAATYGWRVQGKAAIASSDDTSVTLRFKGSGTDTLIVDKIALCGTTSDTLLIRVTPPPVVDLGNDTTLCSGAVLALDAGSTWSSYWWNNGATTQTISVSTAGTYWVEVSNPGGCKGRDTIQVRESESSLSVDLGKDTTLCQGRAVVLDAGAGYGSYRWQDGSRERTFTAFGPGRYWVTVGDACGTQTATDTLAVFYTNSQKIDLGSDRTVCAGQRITLDAGPGFAHYLWPDGSSEQTFTLREPGRYWVVGATQSGCFASDTITVQAGVDPVFLDLGPDTTMCREETLILNASIPDGDAYSWNDASTSSTLTVSEAGTYWVEVRRGDCTKRDSITVTWRECAQKVWIPNVITPNGDGKNDTFAFKGTGNGPVQLTITNRYGRAVYANRHYVQDWSGEEVANGVYYYHVVDTASGKVYRGWVQVLR